MNITSFPLGPLGTNCYIVKKGTKALIFDPGGDPEKVISYLEENNLKPLCILLTHAHFDHIGAVAELRKHYNIDVYLHENEKDWLNDPILNGSRSFIGSVITTDQPDQLIDIGQMEIGPFQFEVIHTPGHSPGSVSFIFDGDKEMISGDVLFQGGVGRTDLPEGSFDVLVKSIKEKLYSLSDDYIVYPGHGGPTTIGEERRTNPFIKE